MLITVLKYVGLIIISYLLGSIIFGRLLSKLQKDDITKHGSGNPGTTNMLRNYGVMYGLLTFVLDALKGVAAALIGYFMFGGADGGVVARAAIYIGGVSAVIGHMFPIFFKFKGGKGVATASGIAFVAHPIVGAILFAVYIVLLLLIRIGSVCSLIVALAYAITDTVMLIMEQNYVGLGLLYFVILLIVWAHRENIKRLLNKKENVLDLNEAVQKDIDRFNALKNKRKNKNNQLELKEEQNEIETNKVTVTETKQVEIDENNKPNNNENDKTNNNKNENE